jgi:nucleoside phosphorylase
MLGKFDDIRIAVIVALPEEYEIFCHYFRGKIVEKFHVSNLTIDILEREGASERIGLVSVNRMGNVAAGIAAARLLEVFNLDVVINIGLAAGVDKEKQALGDVIVADKIRYYETGKMQKEEFEVAPEFVDLHSYFIQALKTANPANWPLGSSIGGAPRRVSFGTVASGEKVISNAQFVSALLSHDRKTIGIEMESYGIAAAVHGRKEKFLLIRGICDFADPSKNDKARVSAMEGAVRFFDEALRRGLFKPSDTSINVPKSGTSPQAHELTLTERIERGGIANNYIQIARSGGIDEYKFRKSVIDKMVGKFGSLGEIRRFCFELQLEGVMYFSG